jgi:hypothetical protein
MLNKNQSGQIVNQSPSMQNQQLQQQLNQNQQIKQIQE